MIRALVITAAVLLAVPAQALAHGPAGPLDDLLAVGQGFGQTPDPVPTVKREAPPFAAAPRARCDSASRPEPDIQGRVPAGSATDGLWCNVRLLSQHGTSGGFKVFRYVDRAGRECAYYDTALLFPLNAFNLNSSGLGVTVLDMSDPRAPGADRHADRPGDALAARVAQPQRAARAAGRGQQQPGRDRGPGVDLRPARRLPAPRAAVEPARRAVRARERLRARRQDLLRDGHERAVDHGDRRDRPEGAARDLAGQPRLARDVAQRRRQPRVHRGSHHRQPQPADPRHERDPGAQARARRRRRSAGSPGTGRRSRRTRCPFTRDGHPYVLEFDEYNAGTQGDRATRDDVGAARIVDIADEREPRIVSHLRLEVHEPEGHRAASGDPGVLNGLQGYAVHYCGIPTRKDPKVVACSSILSGLRVFDISDVRATARDRLLRRADARQGRERLPAERLRDVAARVRARHAGHLVHGRHERLLRAADQQGGVAEVARE